MEDIQETNEIVNNLNDNTEEGICPECGNRITDKMGKCPSCGYILKKKNKKKIVMVIGCIILVALVIFVSASAIRKQAKYKRVYECAEQLEESLYTTDGAKIRKCYYVKESKDKDFLKLVKDVDWGDNKGDIIIMELTAHSKNGGYNNAVAVFYSGKFAGYVYSLDLSKVKSMSQAEKEAWIFANQVVNHDENNKEEINSKKINKHMGWD